MTEFITRNHGQSCFEVIIKTTDPEHYEASVEFVRRLIDHVKPATDNNVGSKWIPVTERLPEPGERVLTTDGAFVGEMYIDKHGKWRRYNVNDHLLLMALDILFWMPLPEPPKEEDQ